MSQSSCLCRSFLRTLDSRNISNGSAEMLKMASIKDAPLFSILEQHAEQLRSSNFQVCAASTLGVSVHSTQLHRAALGLL